MDEDHGQESLEARVVAMGNEGLDRVSIAGALGWGLDRLKAYEADHPAFADAMQLAETAAAAWMCRRIRERLLAKWDWDLWQAFMDWQFPIKPPEAPEPASNWRRGRRWRPGVGYV